ncbi:MAG: HK97 family phage prohead protease [Acidobacteriota bacterium]
MTKKLETKDLKFTLTDMDDDRGTFTGYASVFDTVDAYGDIVARGAFKKTLREKKVFPMLWSHNVMEPIGIIRGEEDEKGLKIQGELNLDVQRGAETRSLMKQKAVNGLSVGFRVIRDGPAVSSPGRLLKEIDLWEISPCVFQACPGANPSQVKMPAFDDYISAEGHEDDIELLYGLGPIIVRPDDERRLIVQFDDLAIRIDLLKLQLGALSLMEILKKENL